MLTPDILSRYSRHESTDDGLEASFAVNYLSHFLFTDLLLQSMDPKGRIVVVSSWTHDPSYYVNSGHITNEQHKTVIPEGGPQVLAKPPSKAAKGDEYKAGMRRYGMSKTLMVMFMYGTCQSSLAVADFVLGTNFSVVSRAQSTPTFQSLPSIREQWEIVACSRSRLPLYDLCFIGCWLPLL